MLEKARNEAFLDYTSTPEGARAAINALTAWLDLGGEIRSAEQIRDIVLDTTEFRRWAKRRRWNWIQATAIF